jgi:hypothetical protein
MPRRLKHLVVHGGVTAGGSGRDSVGGRCSLTTREVVSHFGVKLLDGLLLKASLATTATTSSAAGLATSTSSTINGLLGGSRLRLVLLRLCNAVGESGRADGSWESACANEHLDTDRAAIDLDSVQGGGGLGSLVVLVEDNRSNTNAVAPGVILQEDPLWSAYVDC